MVYRHVVLLVSIGLLLGAGCATPVMPAGGPPDRTPPELVTSEPTAESVNVRTDRVLLEFSKPIDEASLRQAVSITPDFTLPLEVIVRGRRAEIRFPEALRPETTYLLTLGTDLRDLRNNRIPDPTTIAFATGPQLDEGRIGGMVRDPITGEGIREIALFAYPLASEDAELPDPRTEPPAYRTETGSDGHFRLEYLREAPYFIVAVEDRNRNRRADPGEAFAVPREPAIWSTPADDDSTPVELFLTSVDTLAPEPVRVRPRSERRIAVRFTEAIVLAEADPDAFAITDSLSGRSIAIRAVFPDEDRFQIVLETERMARNPHGLHFARPEAVRDSAGNVLSPSPLAFTPSADPDTATTRIVGFEPAGRDGERTLRPGEVATVHFSIPPTDPSARQGIAVTDSQGSPIEADIQTDDGIRYRIDPVGHAPFQVRVQQPDSLYAIDFSPLPADSLGDLSGRVEGVPAEEVVMVEVRKPDGYAVRSTLGDDHSFRFTGLPAGSYTLRVYSTDAGGDWPGGTLSPYRPPGLLKIVPEVRVRARWEHEMEPIELVPPPE